MFVPRFHPVAALALALVAPAIPVATQEAAPDPALLQKKTAEWIETRRIISEEAARWELEKATLGDLNEIRRRETASLEEFAKAAGERVDTLDEQQKKSAAEKTALQQWRATFEVEITGLENTLKPLLPAFPTPLRDKIGDTIARLETPSEEVPLQNRARDVMLILQAAHEFQNTLTLSSEVREVAGEKHEVEVLYLGMTQAWFTDASGRHSGTGTPGPDGWVWRNDPGLAPSIRRAIEVQKRAATPAFVTLPFQNGNAKEETP